MGRKILTTEGTLVTSLPVAILYTNRRVTAEASEVLYGSNRILFDVSAKLVLKFLRSTALGDRFRIKDLGFDQYALRVDGKECTQHWEKLTIFIDQHMRVDTFTFQIPSDIYHIADESRESKRGPTHTRHRWLPAKGLTLLLMDAKIHRLKLAFGVKYHGNISDPRSDTEEEFTAIEELRYPFPDEEWEREKQEFGKHWEYNISNGLEGYTNFDALHKEQKRRRQRLDFVVDRVDNPPGEIGTVLVLTRPANC